MRACVHAVLRAYELLCHTVNCRVHDPIIGYGIALALHLIYGKGRYILADMKTDPDTDMETDMDT